MAYVHCTGTSPFGQIPLVGKADLPHILALADHEPLLDALRQYNRTGRPPYSVAAMWRAILTKYLLGLRYNSELIDLLRSNSTVYRLCGFTRGLPSPSIISRFVKRLTHHQDLVDDAIRGLVNKLADVIKAPRVGHTLAIDSTDIPAWVNTQRRPFSDPDAEWGYRTDPSAPDGKGMFYGYKLHLICDANYGIPLAHEIRPANDNDSPTLPCLVDKALASHPGLKPRYLAADKGYDALTNYRHLDQRCIIPVIPLRNTDKEGLYDQLGRPLCFGNQPMEYIRTDPEGHLFRCPQEGCRLKDKVGMTLYCDIEHHETLEGDALRKVGRLPRTTLRWKRLYRQRTSVERAFRSLKHSRLLTQNRFRGLDKVRLHTSLSLMAYCATMLARVEAGQMDRMRMMRVRVPASEPPAQMRLDDCLNRPAVVCYGHPNKTRVLENHESPTMGPGLRKAMRATLGKRDHCSL